MSVRIRAAEPSDAAALSALAQRAKAHWGYPVAWLARWKRELTLTAPYLTVNTAFVATEGVTPIGVCVLQQTPVAALEHVWVDPGHHGRGVGRALVDTALATARELGFTRVRVESDPFAEAFYLNLGARSIGSVPAPMPGAPNRVLPVLEFTIAG